MKYKRHVVPIAYFLGTLFLCCSNGRFFTPLAAWLSLICLLFVTRRMKPLAGFLLCAVSYSVAMQFAFWKFASSNPANPMFYLPAVLGPLFALAFLADRLMADRFHGVRSTLVFPVVYTAIEWLYGSLSPFGTTGLLGYSQFGFLPFVQLASVTGVYGLSFLIAWVASVVNAALVHNKDRSAMKKPILLCCAVLLCVLAFGSVRLLLPSPSDTVRVAGIHVYDLRASEGKALWNSVERGDWAAFESSAASIVNRLFDASKKEADAGTKIIVWSEISPPLSSDSEDAFVRRAKEFSKAEGVYLVTCPYVMQRDKTNRDVNKLVIFDPSGEIVLTHVKFGGNFLEGTVKGSGEIQVVDTPYGRLSGVICWDQDYPSIMRQAGQKRVDILLAPSADWREIDPIHSVIGYFRAVENGYNHIRPTTNGLSIASDGFGRIFAQVDHYTASDWVLVAQLPTHREFALYPYLGDWVGWGSAIAVAALLIAVFYQYRFPR